jgi:endoglucanase
MAMCLTVGTCSGAAETWPAWSTFANRFVEPDGRVVDLTFGGKSTSEGQAYGLFFALVANQRPRFDAILGWTSQNLSGGKLGERLPAWLWSQHGDGSWGISDENAASDADLWLAYTLLEAGRLWKEPRYEALGRRLLLQIRSHEIVEAGGGHPILLPAPVGFALEQGRFRIDPSYLPGFIFRYLTVSDPEGPWSAVWNNYVRLAPSAFPAGIAPDTLIINSDGSAVQDGERGPSASYDAIRVYLWAGMSVPSSVELLKQLRPYATLIGTQGTPPEKLNPVTGAVHGSDFSPIGFSGAVLPFLSAMGDTSTMEKQQERLHVAAFKAGLGESTNYYDQALILFGEGWLDRQYAFDGDGRLSPRWAR